MPSQAVSVGLLRAGVPGLVDAGGCGGLVDGAVNFGANPSAPGEAAVGDVDPVAGRWGSTFACDRCRMMVCRAAATGVPAGSLLAAVLGAGKAFQCVPDHLFTEAADAGEQEDLMRLRPVLAGSIVAAEPGVAGWRAYEPVRAAVPDEVHGGDPGPWEECLGGR